MTVDEAAEQILARLDRIVALLELQTFVPDGEPECPHESVTDVSTMGMMPNERVQCNACKKIFTRKDTD